MASGCDGRGKDTRSGLACRGRDEIRLVRVVESREIVACNRMGTIFNSQLPRPAATSQALPPEDSVKYPHKLGGWGIQNRSL